MEWLQGLKASSVQDVATSNLGLKSGRLRTLGPCPSCGAEKRGGQDSRPPIGIAGDGRGWQCHACGVRGDVVELVCLAVWKRSTKDMTSDEWGQLREWATQRGLVTRDDGERSQGRGGRKAWAPPPALSAQALLAGGGRRLPRSTSEARHQTEDEAPQELPAPAGRFSWTPTLTTECAAALWGESVQAKQTRDYLMQTRCLPEVVLREWSVGVYVVDGVPVVNDAGRPYIVTPLPDSTGKHVNARFRSVPIVGTCSWCNSPFGCSNHRLDDGTKVPGCKEYRVCTGRPLPLFGSHRLSTDHGLPVLVTEGEFDVLAMSAYGYRQNVVSGTAGADTFKDEWLDQLEPYETIFGLYDGDSKGEEGWKKLVEKLGVYKCSRVALPVKDANECLWEGIAQAEIQRAIDAAKPEHGMNFRRVDSFSDEIETLIEHPELLKGVPTGSKKLDQILGGWRPGVIVIMGESGHGKTTLATWAILQQAKAGIPVLITSFEQRPIGTTQKLLRMQVGRDFTTVTQKDREHAMQELGGLPIYILDHYGNIPPEQMIEAIRYCKRRLGIRFFMIDHLEFLIDDDVEDERRAIKIIMKTLELVSKMMDVEIVLIVHPRNDSSSDGKRWRPMDYTRAKGSSSIRQLCDDFLIIDRDYPDRFKGQKVKRPWPQTRVILDKGRSEFAMAGGEVALAFDPGSCCYADEWSDTPSGKLGLIVPRAAGWSDDDDRKKKPRTSTGRTVARKKPAPEDESQQQALEEAGGAGADGDLEF